MNSQKSTTPRQPKPATIPAIEATPTGKRRTPAQRELLVDATVRYLLRVAKYSPQDCVDVFSEAMPAEKVRAILARRE
jgi:hypothetical protein